MDKIIYELCSMKKLSGEEGAQQPASQRALLGDFFTNITVLEGRKVTLTEKQKTKVEVI
jgi:hypothetical protein